MAELPVGFGEGKAWRVLPNGIRIERSVFWGGNVEYEALYGDDLIGEYRVERYSPEDGNHAEINGKRLARPERPGWSATFHQWIAALKARSITDNLARR